VIRIYRGIPPASIQVIDEAPPPTGEPPPVGALTWTKLATGGSFGAYFRRPVMLPNGDIWMAWGSYRAPSAAEPSPPWLGSCIFRMQARVFERTTTLVGPTHDVGLRENYGAWYDPSRNCIWIGAGAPVSYGFPGGPQDGTLRFDIATSTYSLAYPYTDPMERMDSALLYHGNYLYAVGSWENHSPKRRNLATGAIESYGGTPRPQFSIQHQYGPDQSEGARMACARVDITPEGTLLAIANDNELWECPLNGQWALIPTTGEKPTALSIVTTYVHTRNCIVAWCGHTATSGGAGGTTPRQTWLLDRATRVWHKGPGLATGEVVPTATVQAQANLLSDGASAFLVADIPYGNVEVWALQWGSL
jgi:hypothetical protein